MEASAMGYKTLLMLGVQRAKMSSSVRQDGGKWSGMSWRAGVYDYGEDRTVIDEHEAMNSSGGLNFRQTWGDS